MFGIAPVDGVAECGQVGAEGRFAGVFAAGANPGNNDSRNNAQLDNGDSQLDKTKFFFDQTKDMLSPPLLFVSLSL